MGFNAKPWKPLVIMVMVNFGLAMLNVLFKKMLDGGVNRMVATTYRMIVATIFLAPIAVIFERENRPKLTGRILCLYFFSAFLGTSLAQYFFLLGLEYTTATFTVAFTNMVPAITFALALIFRQETMNIKSNAGRAKVIGTMVCIGGELLLTLYKGLPLTDNVGTQDATTSTAHQNVTAHKWTIGSVMLIIAITMWSSWFVLHAKISQKYPCQYTSTTILSFFGAIQSAGLSLTLERNKTMWVLKDSFSIMAILYAGIVGSGLCYVGMTWCLRQRGPVFTSSFIPLIQMFAAISSFFFLHEQFYFGSVMGSILVIVGLYILLWGKSKDKPEPVNKQDQSAPELEGGEAASKGLSPANSTFGK